MSGMILKVLIVLTSVSTMGATDKPTGFWLSELTHPYYELIEAGYEVDIVSIDGGEAPIDPGSLDMDDPLNKKFMDTPALVGTLKSSKALSDINASEYSAIVFSGGHGTMWDFPIDPAVQDKSMEIYNAGGVIGAICHGPAALVQLTKDNGEALVKGVKVTGFSNEEEKLVALETIVPFMLEDRLKELGAEVEVGAPWSNTVVSDQRVVTGQNPQSASGVGKAIAELLKETN